MKLIKVKDYAEMSKKAAGIIIKEIKKNPSLTIGFATGATPLGLYKELAKAYNKRKMDFSKIKSFNLDEYYPIKKSNKNSYHYYIFNNLFNKINIKRENIHLLNSETKNPKKECEDYEKMIKQEPIDIQILGIGTNGHIGFNEPGSVVGSKTRLVQLAPETIKNNSRFFKKKENFPRKALTMGISTIMKARKILLLASGKTKAEAISCLIKCKQDKKFPATFLKKHRNFTIIADENASFLL